MERHGMNGRHKRKLMMRLEAVSVIVSISRFKSFVKDVF